MNETSRNKTVSRIEQYGPLASALGYIIHAGHCQLNGMITTYRGMTVPEQEIKDKYWEGNNISLTGFTSSTLNREVALGFACGDEVPGKYPLLVEI